MFARNSSTYFISRCRIPQNAYLQSRDGCSINTSPNSGRDTEVSAASKKAREVESNARQDAGSLEQYHSICNRAIHSFLIHHEKTTEIVDENPVNVDQASPESQRTIGRFTNVQPYRDGLFSEIFRARHPETKTVVALKVTSPDTMSPPHDSVREAKILSSAQAKHIIPLIETFRQANGHFTLVFPFMPFSLDMVLHGSLDTPVQKNFIRNIFSGLGHLHGIGIIHRDIKPSNILLATSHGPAYLSDFGTAWSASDDTSEPAEQKILDVGTTCYRPPELLFGYQNYGPELDLWPAGCVVAQIVSLGNKTLFDSGDLGSELALIKSIFETLGTPDLERWPEATTFPDWGKMNFTRYPPQDWHTLLKNADPLAVDLVSNLVEYESGRRLKSLEVLQHAFLYDENQTNQSL